MNPLTVANWTWISGSDSTFGDVGHALDKLDKLRSGNPFGALIDPGFAPAYFSWLGWVLLGAAVVAAAVATSAAGNAAALQNVNGDVPSGYLDRVNHTSFGAWAVLAGFLLLGVAVAIGPRRR